MNAVHLVYIAAMQPTRLFVTGGPVLTMDPDLPRASAILVEDGEIVAVYPPGTAPARPSGARLLDLGGAALLPGFIDAHTHLVHWGLRKARPDLGGTQSVGEALDVVRERDRSLPGGLPLIAE